MAGSIRSEMTADMSDTSGQHLQESMGASVGQFSRVINSSMTLSRTTDAMASLNAANRSPISMSQKDPLSMISMYARKNASLTPDPIRIMVPEEDSDFERDDSPSWRKSAGQKIDLTSNQEEDTTQYYQNGPVDTSQILMIDFISD